MLLAQSDWTSLLRNVSRPGDEITYLLVGGFQRIKSPTAIPMRKLVLLYGPNSAGKSTVLDILSMLNSLCVAGIEEQTDSLVSRWHRNDGDVPLSVGFSMMISQRALLTSIGANKWVSIYSDGGIDPRSGYMDPTERRITWVATWQSATSTTSDTTVGFDVFVGESLLASIRHDRDNGKPTIKIMTAKFEEVFGFLGPYLRDPEGDFGGEMPESPELPCDYLKSFSSYIPRRTNSEADELIRLIFAAPLFIFIGDFFAEEPSYLGPLRWIPRADELRFLEADPRQTNSQEVSFDFFCKSTDERTPKSNRGSLFSDRQADGRYAWRVLASRFVSDLSRADTTLDRDESLMDRINRWLAHEEFFGTGYRIAARLSEIVSIGMSGKSEDTSGSDEPESCAAKRIVNFSLVDSASRRLDFRDVGTGFSQVLPAIICCAVHESITILEQPELHLHPRLQTKLLDLFLESINKKRSSLAFSENSECLDADALLLADRRKSLIVESHSEHIILRLMRRIHESSAADIKHQRLYVMPSDVAVIYFEPEGDETFVHILELTTDGDFADRWPQGFFDERYKEIFDE